MRVRYFLLASALTLSLPAARAQAVYTFDHAATGSFGLGTSAGIAINDSGYIGGIEYQTGNSFALAGDGMHTGILLFATSYTLGLNNSGRAVGQGTTGGSAVHAAYYDLPGAPAAVDLGTLGGTTSAAYGVNASGQIVGYAQTGSADNAFRWTSGTMSNLGTLGGTNSYAYAINASGQTVGESQVTGNGASHAFLTIGLVSGGTDLLTLGGTNSVARAVNTSGQVAGYSQVAGDATEHAFLYTSGATVDLGTAAGFTSSRAFGVNDSGIAVGYLLNASGPDHAFVYANGTLLDLNSLNISGIPAGWYLSEAYGINASGQIVGTAINGSGSPFNFTLTPTGVPLPIPEPATYAALAGLGALGLALWRRQRRRLGA